MPRFTIVTLSKDARRVAELRSHRYNRPEKAKGQGFAALLAVAGLIAFLCANAALTTADLAECERRHSTDVCVSALVR